MNEKPFKITTIVNFDITGDNYIDSIFEATVWLKEKIEHQDFMSGDEKIELNIIASFKEYEVLLYRSWNSIHVWFNWNFVYEIDMNAWNLSYLIEDLFHNWRWVPGIRMIYHWDWCDPELKWCWITANYRQVEDYLYEDFIDWLKDNKQYDKYCKLKHKQQEEKFNAWLFEHYYRIVEIFLQLRDI